MTNKKRKKKSRSNKNENVSQKNKVNLNDPQGETKLIENSKAGKVEIDGINDSENCKVEIDGINDSENCKVEIDGINDSENCKVEAGNGKIQEIVVKSPLLKKIKSVSNHLIDYLQKQKKEDPKMFNAFSALAVVVAAIFIICIMMVVNSGSLPLVTGMEEDYPSSNKESKYVGDFFGKEKTIVYYPSLIGEEGKEARRNAERILFESKGHGGKLSVDYSFTNYNEKYIGIEYTSLENNNTEFFSLEGEEITTEVLGDLLKFHIKMGTKASMKDDEKLASYVSTDEFKEKLESEQIPYEFTITGNEINIIYDNIYEGQGLQFSLPLDTFSNSINLDLGVEQKNPEMKATSPLRYVDPNKPMVALTFDDGPVEENTRPIIEELYKYDGAATFYVLGGMASRASQHEVLIDMVNMGNEIGAHSVTHANLSALANSKEKKDTNRLNNELYKVQDDIKAITGGYVVETYRPPYGLANSKVRAKGNFPFIYWTVDSLDWYYRDADKIYNKVMKEVGDGDVVLLHDLHKETVEASIRLIETLSEEGYQLVTVSELMEAKEIKAEPHKVYFR